MITQTIVGLLAGLVWTSVSLAEERYSEAEVGGLPGYCRDAFGFREQYGNDPQTVAYWRQQLGPTMGHIHHYCRGMLMINRARGATGPNKSQWYGASIGEIDYVLRHVSDSFVLLPEMLTRKGEALTHLRRFADADAALRKAIELRSDYWPAYLRLAQSLVERKNTQAAREVLQRGLANAKEPRPLQRMLDELDKGKG